MNKRKKSKSFYISLIFLALVFFSLAIILIIKGNPGGKEEPHDTVTGILLKDESASSGIVTEEIKGGGAPDEENVLTPEDSLPDYSPGYAGKAADSTVSPVLTIPVAAETAGSVFYETYEEEKASEKSSYSCGVPPHHCRGVEDHLFTISLEEAGCPYCSSHSCPSFYGTDEFGNPSYDPSLCPDYSENDDPLLYCEYCGRKSGNGKDGTCARFINDALCQFCGRKVTGGECHTCG